MQKNTPYGVQLIPAAGVEPARPCGHWILSPARLPIPPRRQSFTGVAGFEPTHEGVKVPCLTAWLYPKRLLLFYRKIRRLSIPFLTFFQKKQSA